MQEHEHTWHFTDGSRLTVRALGFEDSSKPSFVLTKVTRIENEGGRGAGYRFEHVYLYPDTYEEVRDWMQEQWVKWKEEPHDTGE